MGQQLINEAFSKIHEMKKAANRKPFEYSPHLENRADTLTMRLQKEHIENLAAVTNSIRSFGFFKIHI